MLFRNVTLAVDCYRPSRPWHGLANKFVRLLNSPVIWRKPPEHIMFRSARIVLRRH